MNETGVHFSDAEIVSARPAKNSVNSRRPYAFFVEPERTAEGQVEDTATVFLTNRECPFRCLFCDLWKNTTDVAVAAGAILEQIDFALGQLPESPHVKLYNSGNFFDPQAIPRSDLRSIAERVCTFRTVIVENHPRLCNEMCLQFRDQVGTQLEVAMGLETVHPGILSLLNKQMTIGDFDRAVDFLVRNDISVRAFILLRPPFLTEEEGCEWAIRSIEHAFAAGARCCSVIPVRGGNGILDRLQKEARFSPPRLRSLETVLETGIQMQRGRVFADLWDADQLETCPRCRPRRVERLRQMNLSQTILTPPSCNCETDV